MVMKNEQSADVIEIEAVEGRLEFGFWGWLDHLGKEIWHWFTGHCTNGSGTCTINY